MSKKIKITDFESFFPVTLLDAGREAAHASDKMEIEENKGYLKAIIYDQGERKIESTIHKTIKYILGFDCNCHQFSRSKGCKHITAILYTIKDRSSRLTPVKRSNKFSIDQIFEVSNKEELTSFIRYFASNNAAFNKLFRHYFDYKFSGLHNDFDLYLQNIIRLYTDSSGKISVSALRQITQLLELHLFRIEGLLQSGEMTMAADITMSVLTVALRMAGKSTTSAFNYVIGRCHHIIQVIVSQNIAPSLRRKINQFALVTILNENYTYTEPESLALIIYQNHAGETIQQSIIKAIVDKLNQQEEGSGAWLKILYTSLKFSNKFDRINFYTSWLSDDRNFKQFISEQSSHTEDLDIKMILEARVRKITGLEGREFISTIAQFCINNKYQDIYALLFNKLIREGMAWEKVAIVTQIDQVVSKKEFIRSLLDKVVFDLNDKSQFYTYLQLLNKGGNYENLLELLKQNKDLILLVPFLSSLLKYKDAETTDLLIETLKVYLDEHVGNQSHKVVEEIVSQLLFSKYVDSARQVISSLQSSFGNRKLLMNSLKSYALT